MFQSILLADDHAVVRKGLRTILEKEMPDCAIAEAGDGIQTVEMAQEVSPELVVLDIGMPGLNGLEAIPKILSKKPGTKILVLSIHKDKDFVIQALRRGAAGYLLKECAVQELVGAIEAVARGKRYLSAALSHLVQKDAPAGEDNLVKDKLERLSLREREILSLLAEGRSNSQIADKLFISPETVKTHRKNIMTKLGLHSILALAKFAHDHSLTLP